MKFRALLSFFLAAFSPAKADPDWTSDLREDMLELHYAGTATGISAVWEWRLNVPGAGEHASWQALPEADNEGKFKLATPISEAGWESLEIRAREGEAVRLSRTWTCEPHGPLQMLTPTRIDALPDPDRKVWQDYLARSKSLALQERRALAMECRKLGRRASSPAPEDSKEFEFDDEKMDVAWYATAEATKLADVVLTYQTPSGGWSKAVDYAKGPRQPGAHWTSQDGKGWHYCGTLDNRATTEQIKFLAQVAVAHNREDCRTAVLRGIDWLLAAQFPNGGWPQVYPLEPGYHEAITFNDGAVTHALEVLHAVSHGDVPFDWVPAGLKQKAAAAFDRGLNCLLACQVRLKGVRTVWCAQHDPLALVPVAARLKEPPSLSGGESAVMLRFLMRKGPLNEEMRGVVNDGIAWLESKKIIGLRRIKNEKGRTDYVQDPSSTEVLWARFYSLESGLPIFPGAGDGVVYATYHEMAQHNKVAYDYFTNKPRDLKEKEWAKWEKRWKQGK